MPASTKPAQQQACRQLRPLVGPCAVLCCWLFCRDFSPCTLLAAASLSFTCIHHPPHSHTTQPLAIEPGARATHLAPFSPTFFDLELEARAGSSTCLADRCFASEVHLHQLGEEGGRGATLLQKILMLCRCASPIESQVCEWVLGIPGGGGSVGGLLPAQLLRAGCSLGILLQHAYWEATRAKHVLG